MVLGRFLGFSKKYLGGGVSKILGKKNNASFGPFFMANGKTKKQLQKNVENLWPKKTLRKIVDDPLWDGEKNRK